MTVPPMERLSDPIALVYRHWLDLREAAGRLPAIRALDLASIRSTLPHLWLLEVVHAPIRFRYRVIGENIYRMAGRNIRVGDLIEGTAARPGQNHVHDRLVQVVETGRPDHYAGPPLAGHTPALIRIERIALPFASDGRTVDRILNCTVADWEPGYRPPPPLGSPG